MGVCHEMPVTLPMSSPWQPWMRLTVGGQMLLIIGQSTVIVRSCTFGLSLSGPALSVGHCQVLHFRSVIVRSCTFGRSLSLVTPHLSGQEGMMANTRKE